MWKERIEKRREEDHIFFLLPAISDYHHFRPLTFLERERERERKEREREREGKRETEREKEKERKRERKREKVPMEREG